MSEPYVRKTARKESKATEAKEGKQSKGTTMPVLKNMNVSISQIENGYLVHHSGEHKGKYVSKTIYSPTNPVKVTNVKFGKT